MIKRLVQFFLRDLWRISLHEVSRITAFRMRFIRVIVLTFRGYYEDNCSLRASALTFYSMLSLVPVIALVFAVAQGFGFETTLESQLLEKFPTHQQVVGDMVTFAKGLLEQTRGGVIAGIGVIFLLWVLIKLLGHIEVAFNSIWNVKRSRPLVRKFSDYLSMLIVGPLFFVMASSATVVAMSVITSVANQYEVESLVGPVTFVVMRLIPYVLSWILFALVYIVMPNTKVTFRSGIVAGVVAGTVYQLVQWVYITFQIGVAMNNALYGSFAALPLFLIWLQISWIIVLLGAEMSYALQNVDNFEFEHDCNEMSEKFKKLVALRIAALIVKNFCNGGSILNDGIIARDLRLPLRLVSKIIRQLTAAGIIADVVVDSDGTLSYHPAHDANRYTISYVLASMDRSGSESIPISPSPELKKIKTSLEAFARVIESAPENILLKEL